MNLYCMGLNQLTRFIDILGKVRFEVEPEGSSSQYTTGDDDSISVSIGASGSCLSGKYQACNGKLTITLHVSLWVKKGDKVGDNVMEEDNGANVFLDTGTATAFDAATTMGDGNHRQIEVEVGKIDCCGEEKSGKAEITATRGFQADGITLDEPNAFYEIDWSLKVEKCGRITGASATAKNSRVISQGGDGGWKIEGGDEHNWWPAP